MEDKVFGYKIILTDDQEYLWASEVSALATSFMENGFERFHNDESFCYTIRKREVFFERKHRKFPLFGAGSWCRYSEFEDLTSGVGGQRYVVDYRKGMDGENKKFRFPTKPTNFDVEQVCGEYFGLVKIVQTDGNEYHFFFEACDENDKEVKALIELEASCKDYSYGKKKSRAIVCSLKDRTEEAYGSEAFEKMSDKIHSAFKIMRARAKENGYGTLITNPYMDAYFMTGADYPSEFDRE